jgi:hypothetical protein
MFFVFLLIWSCLEVVKTVTYRFQIHKIDKLSVTFAGEPPLWIAYWTRNLVILSKVAIDGHGTLYFVNLHSKGGDVSFIVNMGEKEDDMEPCNTKKRILKKTGLGTL